MIVHVYFTLWINDVPNCKTWQQLYYTTPVIVDTQTLTSTSYKRCVALI